MAFEIVDGMTGTKHISSDDLAALNTATIGKADCVLEYGDDFKLTMASANSATLGTGVGMVGGKRFWNQAATSLTIQSGTQGQKRNDLVVARYQKTSAGIESITPVVIKGTPTTGTAADPATTANDLKLWRVPLDGINAGTPVKLFEPVTPLATLGESVSLLYKGSTTGTVSLSESAANFARLLIRWEDTDGLHGSVHGANGETVSLVSVYNTDVGTYIKQQKCKISGSSITRTDAWQRTLMSGTAESHAYFKIVEVIGYRK